MPADASPDLSIVVLFTHDADLARRCVEGIAAVADELPAAETVFVLGASSEAVRDVIATTSGANVIDSPVNTGTSVGWQLAFNACKGRHVLLMHEDSVPLPGMVPALVAALETDPAAAVVGPWLIERQNDQPSNCGWAWFRNGLGSRLSPEHIPEDLRESAYAVDGVSSAISLWDRSKWLEGGGFDERNFPAIGVDADACTSAWARGYSVIVEPRARGIHRTGAMDDAPGRLSGRYVRYYMLERFTKLWLEKWGPIADWYQPVENEHSGEFERVSLENAQRRRAERPRFPGEVPLAQHPLTDPDGTGAKPTGVDAELAGRLEGPLSAAMDEYHEWLIGFSEQQGDEIEHLNETIRTASAREANVIDERDLLRAELDAIRSGGWWRLRGRLRRLVGRRD